MAKKAANTDSKLPKVPSVLAFERKIDPSDAMFFSGVWGERDADAAWEPVSVTTKSVRGTASNRMANEEDLNKKIKNPNLQTIDAAALPYEHDTLKIRFTVRFMGNIAVPNACNDSDFRALLEEVVRGYENEVGFEELGYRYAYAIASGRAAFRNRIAAQQVEVRVQKTVKGEMAKGLLFDGLSLPLREFDEHGDVRALGNQIAEAFSGNDPLLLEVVMYLQLGHGAEVYPSQELILDKKADESDGKKSRTLYSVTRGGISIAGMHSQKIGNAIRTIDDWHGDEDQGPIAVEPYGSVTTQAKAYRSPKTKLDFYTLFDNWVLRGETPELNQQHYLIANLIRGGVVGGA